MAEVQPVTRTVTYTCVGLDGQEACSIGDDGSREFGVVEGTVTERVEPGLGLVREWSEQTVTCPVCGRTDGFETVTGDEVSA